MTSCCSGHGLQRNLERVLEEGCSEADRAKSTDGSRSPRRVDKIDGVRVEGLSWPKIDGERAEIGAWSPWAEGGVVRGGTRSATTGCRSWTICNESAQLAGVRGGLRNLFFLVWAPRCSFFRRAFCVRFCLCFLFLSGFFGFLFGSGCWAPRCSFFRRAFLCAFLFVFVKQLLHYVPMSCC